MSIEKKRDPVKEASWDGILVMTEALRREFGVGIRSSGTFSRDGDESLSTAYYEAYRDDGTRKGFSISVRVEEYVNTNDAFWREKKAVPESRRVVVDHAHYMLGDEPGDYTMSSVLGFGGREFTIAFFDGRTVTTRNLWYQGKIPPKWRETFPNNAVFVTVEKGAA